MDQTPLTLPSRSPLHLAVSYFQKLGLRYVLFSDRGVLQGLLTKKDVWYVLNGADETRRSGRETGESTGGGVGISREAGQGEHAGLLNRNRGGGGENGSMDDMHSPGADGACIL